MTHVRTPPLVFGALVMGALVLTGSQAAAYECKPFRTQATSSHAMKFKARSRARARWQTYVRHQHGLPWSVWKIAKNKRTSCRPNGSKWTCRAVAKACKYVPVS